MIETGIPLQLARCLVAHQTTPDFVVDLLTVPNAQTAGRQTHAQSSAAADHTAPPVGALPARVPAHRKQTLVRYPGTWRVAAGRAKEYVPTTLVTPAAPPTRRGIQPAA